MKEKNIEEDLLAFYKNLRYKHTKGTAERYYRSTKTYVAMIGGAREALFMSYQDIMDYINQLRNRNYTPTRITTDLAGIKSYHDYLHQTRQRLDNPAKGIVLLDARKKPIQHQDLFTTKELEELLKRKNRYQQIANRNQFIISLYIYQGLTTGEIRRLKKEDIKEDGSVYIQASTTTNARHLQLTPKQMHFAMTYIQQERKELLKKSKKANHKIKDLFISKIGTTCKTDDFSYLIECQKDLFSTRKLNPKTIRQSVITNWFKQGKSIREIQLMAGHKYASTTIKYRPTDLDALTNSLARFHPLG